MVGEESHITVGPRSSNICVVGLSMNQKLC